MRKNQRRRWHFWTPGNTGASLSFVKPVERRATSDSATVLLASEKASLLGITHSGISSKPTSLDASMTRPACFYIEGTIVSTVVAHASRFPLTCKSVGGSLYTPSVTNTPKRVGQEVQALRLALSYLVDATRPKPEHEPVRSYPVADPTELLLVDETDRLKTASLEQICDLYDRHPIGVVLIGMPGLEKRLSRYAQLYSRVGFAHEFRFSPPKKLGWYCSSNWHSRASRFTQRVRQRWRQLLPFCALPAGTLGYCTVYWLKSNGLRRSMRYA